MSQTPDAPQSPHDPGSRRSAPMPSRFPRTWTGVAAALIVAAYGAMQSPALRPTTQSELTRDTSAQTAEAPVPSKRSPDESAGSASRSKDPVDGATSPAAGRKTPSTSASDSASTSPGGRSPSTTQNPKASPARTTPTPQSATTADGSTVKKREKESDARLQVPDMVIRDQSGRVAFRGEIDLKSTLDRIESGGRNQHRNDGSTFQNREGRLPKKPAGYYKEYVHPTPGISGPGPQRVVMGRDGEVFYTPDHYRTFRRIR